MAIRSTIKVSIILMLTIGSGIVLNACKISTPFKGPGYKSGSVFTETPDDEVLVGLTYIETGKLFKLNRVFWKHVLKVYNSMEEHDGLIAYSIRREFFGKKGWTMTVWKDEASMLRFVNSEVHQDAILNGLPALTRIRFARSVLHKSELPLTWDEAETILETQGKEY